MTDDPDYGDARLLPLRRLRDRPTGDDPLGRDGKPMVPARLHFRQSDPTLVPKGVKHLLTSVVDLVADDQAAAANAFDEALATRAFWDRRLSLRWDRDAWLGEVSVLVEASRVAEFGWPLPVDAA